MAKSKEISPKKQARQQVIAQLATALPGIEDALGKKEFNSRLKKAAKILTDGIKVKSTKKEKTVKKGKAVKKVKVAQESNEKAG